MRLRDNAALRIAAADHRAVLPLFVFEPSLVHAPETSAFHVRCWQSGLSALGTDLGKLGARVHIATAEVVDTLEALFQRQPFGTLVSHEETGSALTYVRDRRVKRWCRQRGVRWVEPPHNGVIRGLRDRGKRGATISERLFKTALIPPPTTLSSWEEPALGSVIPTLAQLGVAVDPMAQLDALAPVTEHAARADLRSFIRQRGVGYSGGISSPNTAFVSGSRLSAHLAWGTLSLRTAFRVTTERLRSLSSQRGRHADQWRRSLRAFQSRLHWHDHFIQRLESAPDMETTCLNPAYEAVRYRPSETVLQAWLDGQTGHPMVDATMRCLRATGFVNFRMRAMVVNVACFGLLQPWQSLVHPLARLFYDYEPGIHVSQIQMQAGVVGINAMRVYSPRKQLVDQDPHCRFVKQWLPELRPLPAGQILAYESAPLPNYPRPIADVAANARVMKAELHAIRKSDAGRRATEVVLVNHGSRKAQPKRSAAPAKRRSAQMRLRL